MIRQEASRLTKANKRESFLEEANEYLEKRLDFLEARWRLWQKKCTTVNRLLDRIREFVSAEDNAIRLSTIHRAKGLEESRVFIVEYDRLPLLRQEMKEWEATQELNLKYVAVTRARETLFLVESEDDEE